MGEEIINPGIQEEQPVAEQTAVEQPVQETEQQPAQEQNLADKSLSELSDVFKALMESADRMTRSKEAEAIKSAFYKLLLKLKSESSDTFEAVEENFKELYADYKRERAEYNKEQDALKEENLVKKKAIIEELKALVDGQDDVSSSFPVFRELQDRWRAVGPVPATDFRDINQTYQFNVERFYDKVKINRELRDLDFQKNLEAKEKFCEAAEKLSENENIVSAFNELQKLHEQWKEYGPVAREFRESIWARFQAATAVINKRYQAHFEEQKEKQKENLVAKEALCVKVEEIAAREIGNSEGWNASAKEIEGIQAEWRKIGFATRKDNQKVYDRFRAACDAFYARKRDFYSQFKNSLEENLARKQEIIRQAEELKSSTEWKKTAERFVELQKQWKEIGAVPRKKSDQLWKQFRAACDEFFGERDKNASPENNYYANLRAKKKIIDEINAYESAGDAAADNEAVGFVPFKEKENVAAAYREAMNSKFPGFGRPSHAHARGESRPRERSPKDTLIQQYRNLQQEIETYENNIGFFSASKNSEALIKQMEGKIAAAKEDLKALEEKIRKFEEGEQ